MKWERKMTHEEVKVVDLFLRGGDSPVRHLVCQLLDRIEMNERTKAHHTDPMVRALCEARVEAYRYTIMTAIRLQEAQG
jgi:hypothetical protein